MACAGCESITQPADPFGAEYRDYLRFEQRVREEQEINALWFKPGHIFYSK